MDIFKSNIVVGLTAALAATVLAPVLIPVIATASRPLAKSLIKGGVMLYERGREAVSGAGEVMEDLIAEVRSEFQRQHESPSAASEAAPESEPEESAQVYKPQGGNGSDQAFKQNESAPQPRPQGEVVM